MPDQYLFGRVALRPAQRQLLIDGQPAVLGARAFDLLLALVENRDRLVSKNELLDFVWPGLVVEENNLQVHVSALRKLLGPQAIATIPGRGYRFTLASDEPPAAPPSPPRTLALPERSLPLLGRDAELASLLALLEQHALVTLVGPGGIGKTTLARCAAQAHGAARSDGVAWVELASLTDPRLIAGTVAQALSLQLASGGDALTALVTALKPMQLLLVIDNAEHLLDDLAVMVQALLQGTPGVRLLVTSQVPLRLQGEQVLRLDALAVPEAGSNALGAAQHGAVALFTERARAADRRFALTDSNVRDVIEICQRLDGLPLALELAAARVPLLGVRGVAERLDDRFKLLAGGSRSAPSRHQTLQAALEWSLALLPEAERGVFQQLGVFAGGFTLSLASAVLASLELDEWALIDALATLTEHSLLSVSASDPPRYALSETARAYALAQLQSGTEHDTLRTRHAAALRHFFEASPSDWLQMSDVDWLACYEPELDNLRAALGWANAQGDGQTVVALVGSAAPLWHHLSLHGEARQWHDLSESMLDASTPKPLAAQWWRAAQWAWSEMAPERARAAAEQAHRLYRELGDVHGLYAELAGLAGMWSEPNAQARAALEEALALEKPDWPARERAWGQRARADVARAEGRLSDSREAREAELVLRMAAGDERGRLRAMSHLADLALALGEVDEAVQRGRALVALLRAQRSPSTLCVALWNLIHALKAQGDAEGAQALMPEASALARDFGMPGQKR
ncbi:MAG: helix-turn-helix transcriptional regulator [Rhizobacter sp.]|nr:helix-turn-helix transcriptional regulator [Rhizobacter sp.]